MEYEKIYPRNWNFNCAQSGMHPNWSFDNAREFALITQSLGIEPWKIFPGTRQVMIETYDPVTSYQLSILAESIRNSKLGSKVSKVWMAGRYIIYINYIGHVDDEIASKIADFKLGDKIQDLVSDEIAEVVEVTDNAFGLKFEYGGMFHLYDKKIVKCQYKLVKSNEEVLSR